MNEHWIDKAVRENRKLNLNGHFNQPRISAETMLKLVQLKNKLTGVKRSVYEESVIAEERQTDW